MKNYEIIMMLQKIEPENDLQKKALESAEREFRAVTEDEIDESIKDYFMAYSRNDVINKSSGDWYSDYLEFCTDFEYNPVWQSLLTKATRREFNVIVKVDKINGKSKRVFK